MTHSSFIPEFDLKSRMKLDWKWGISIRKIPKSKKEKISTTRHIQPCPKCHSWPSICPGKSLISDWPSNESTFSETLWNETKSWSIFPFPWNWSNYQMGRKSRTWRNCRMGKIKIEKEARWRRTRWTLNKLLWSLDRHL